MAVVMIYAVCLYVLVCFLMVLFFFLFSVTPRRSRRWKLMWRKNVRNTEMFDVWWYMMWVQNFIHFFLSAYCAYYGWVIISHSFYPLAPRPDGVLLLPVSICPHIRMTKLFCIIAWEIFLNFFLKLGWNIVWVNISNKFNHRYCSLLNISFIDQKVILTFFAFLKSFSKLEPCNLIH